MKKDIQQEKNGTDSLNVTEGRSLGTCFINYSERQKCEE